jgi:hypothetical protein
LQAHWHLAAMLEGYGEKILHVQKKFQQRASWFATQVDLANDSREN